MSKNLFDKREKKWDFFLDGHWDLDNPIVQTIEDVSTRQGSGQGEIDDGDNTDPISVMVLAAGRLWCAIRDKIFVVCPNSLNVEVKRNKKKPNSSS
jgi:hypothetical protein